MIIPSGNSNYVETNMVGATNFSIKASAKAFKILSDGLYSDKIRAVVRELSCNALDSHTGAGCPDKPITVHLPNKLEPWFSVKDEGLGLSKENVLKLYTTYFESTKTESNDQIGALGLGSKSPFSYTDSFTIVSNFNGMESMYSSYIGASGEPCIQHILDVESSAPNGVEIKFGVKDEDIKVFKEKAQLVFRAFTVHPTVVGNNDYTPLSRGTLIFKGSTWSLYNTSGGRQSYAVQGSIEYPIDISNIRDLTVEEKFVLNQSIYIDFGIGMLDIAASREQLGYDEVTVANIRAKAKEIYQELVNEANKSIKECKSLWDACIQSKNVLDKIYDAQKYIKPTWKNKQIVSSFEFKTHANILKYSPTHTKMMVKRESDIKYINVDPKFVFVLLDTKYNNKVATNIRYYVKTTGKNVILFYTKYFLDIVGNPSYLKYSEDIPVAPKNAVTSYVKKTSHKLGCNFKKYTGSGYSSSDCEFRASYSSIEDVTYAKKAKNVLYVKILGNASYDGKLYETENEFAKYIGLYDQDYILVGIKNSAFYKESFIKEMNNSEYNFIEFKPFIDAKRKEFLDKPMIKNLMKNISLKTSFNNSSIRERDLVSVLKCNKDDIHEDSYFYHLVNDIEDSHTLCDKMGLSDNIVKYLSKAMDSSITIESVLENSYPMLLIVRNLTSHTASDYIVDYINTMDKVKINKLCGNITEIKQETTECLQETL